MTDVGRKRCERTFLNDSGCQVLELRLGISDFKGFGRGFGRILDLGLSRILKGSWIGDLGFEQDAEHVFIGI